MKRIVAITGVLSLVAATTLAARQHDHATEAGEHDMAMVPAAGGQATVEDDGHAIIITTPPVSLPVMAPGAGMDHAHMGTFPPVSEITVPVHGYLEGFEYEVVDADGNVLPQRIVHHFNIIDPVHKELFLPISQRLLAAGSETGNQSMPRLLFGVPVYLGQKLVVTAMLHNPTGVAHEGVQLRIRLPYVKVGRPWPLFEVYPFQLDVAFPAGDKGFDLPEGESSRSWEGSPSMAGRIMVLGSHLHDLATRITFEDVTEDRVLWTGLPVLDKDGEVAGVTIGHVYRKLGLPITPEHRYRVRVYYNNTTGAAIPDGGMGVVAGVFMPSAGGPWPRADVTNSLYVLDHRHYMREVRGRYDVIAGEGRAAVGAEPDRDHQHEEHR